MREHGSLESRISSQDNNFNLVRLAAAVLVVFYHSFLFNSRWPLISDPFTRLISSYSTNTGVIAVDVFFMISGIFIAQSWLRDPHIGRFLFRRIMRIIPGLSVCVGVTAVISTIFFSQKGINGLSQGETWNYIIQNTFLHFLKTNVAPEDWELPGAFWTLSHRALNAPLWSLYWEARMYVLLGVVGLAALLSPRLWLAATAVFFLLAAQIQPALFASFVWSPELLMFFMAGVLIKCLADRIFVSFHQIIGVFIYLQLMQRQPQFFNLALFFGFVVLWVGCAQKNFFPHIRYNDYSFGIYIYHWPLMQMVRMSTDQIGPVPLFLLLLGLTLPLAILSWHFVELPAMAFAKRVLNRESRYANPLWSAGVSTEG